MVRAKNVMVVTFYDILEIKMSWFVNFIITENLVFLAPTMTFLHDFENLVFSWENEHKGGGHFYFHHEKTRFSKF